MKKIVSIVALMAAFAAPTLACDKPAAPGSIPDGKTAAMEEMMAAKKAVDAYKRDMEEYDFVTYERQLGADWLGPPGKPGKFVDVGKLLGVGLIGRRELADGGVGLLQINIDESRLQPKAEARTGRLLLELREQLARSLVGKFHIRTHPR